MYLALSFATPCHTRPHRVTPPYTDAITPRHAAPRHSWSGFLCVVTISRVYLWRVCRSSPVVCPRSRSFVIVAVRCMLRENDAIGMAEVETLVVFDNDC